MESMSNGTLQSIKEQYWGFVQKRSGEHEDKLWSHFIKIKSGPSYESYVDHIFLEVKRSLYLKICLGTLCLGTLTVLMLIKTNLKPRPL